MTAAKLPRTLGLIGAGRISRLHAATIRAMEEATLAGVYDIDLGLACRFAQEYACRCFESPEALMEAVDGVIVAVPNSYHREYVLLGLDAGRHVLCEKPMAESLDSARKMLQGAPDILNGTIGFNYRFLPIVNVARELLEKGELGEIRSFTATFKKDSAFRRNRYDWRDGPEQQGSSGSLGDLGTHLIDLAFSLLGPGLDSASIQGEVRTNVTYKEGKPVYVDDFANVVCRLSGGARFTLITSKSSPAEELGVAITLEGTRRTLHYDTRTPSSWCLAATANGPGQAFQLPKDRLYPDPPGEIYGWADSLHRQMCDWVSSMNGSRTLCRAASFRDGLLVQEALQAMLDSLSDSQTGKE